MAEDEAGALARFTQRTAPRPGRARGLAQPRSRNTAQADSAAARPNAGAPPVQPTSVPASAGPPANATVRASSRRPFAAASAPRSTSAGTSAGAATL